MDVVAEDFGLFDSTFPDELPCGAGFELLPPPEFPLPAELPPEFPLPPALLPLEELPALPELPEFADPPDDSVVEFLEPELDEPGALEFPPTFPLPGLPDPSRVEPVVGVVRFDDEFPFPPSSLPFAATGPASRTKLLATASKK